jgi:acetyl-CoA synthetase
MTADAFKNAQSCLMSTKDTAPADFQWPAVGKFNWALDWFDAELARGPNRDRLALKILGDDAEALSFAEMAARSNCVANELRARGVRRHDRILLMLGNTAPLWETMLAAMKLGAVVIPSTLMLTAADVSERVRRARIRHVIVAAGETAKFKEIGMEVRRICTGTAPAGWLSFDELRHGSEDFEPEGQTDADDPMLLYFTSGTTSRPKMVLHSHRSYPVGHLATMYWIGARPGDIHLAVAAPGWAGHTFMAFFGPWNAGATIAVLNQSRFDPKDLLDTLIEQQVTSFFAPPTVWRMLIQHDLTRWPVSLREAVSAGEPLNPEVIEQVRQAWGLVVRDGWGQTEATVQIANPPGYPIRPGQLGRVLPGCSVAVLDDEGREQSEGELALPLQPRPPGLMLGYLADDGSLAPLDGRYYRTGDAVRREADGQFSYIGRIDDIFKSANYRISAFELESVLIEHPAIVEAAVVPSPDPIRLAVPKAFIVLASGYEPTADTARLIFQHIRSRLAPFKRIRRIEFAELPKNVAGKIRRVALRQAEAARGPELSHQEFNEADFPA